MIPASLYRMAQIKSSDHLICLINAGRDLEGEVPHLSRCREPRSMPRAELEYPIRRKPPVCNVLDLEVILIRLILLARNITNWYFVVGVVGEW